MTQQQVMFFELSTILPKDAHEWLTNFELYCNKIDDIIDEPKCRADNEFILRTFFFSCELFSSDFYVTHRKFLFPTMLLITNAYADSVKFEQSTEQWKKTIADVTRCALSMMIVQVVYLFVSYDKMREISPRLCACGWDAHHDKLGQSI